MNAGWPTSNRRSIFGRSGPSFPKWRAALDHPLTRTLVIIFQLTALSVAAFSFQTASTSLENSRHLAAYQMIASPVVPPSAKWTALKVVLQGDKTFAHFDNGCAKIEGYMLWGFEQPCGGSPTGLPFQGPPADDEQEYMLLSDFHANQTLFETDSWERIQFVDGELTNSWFGATTVRSSSGTWI